MALTAEVVVELGARGAVKGELGSAGTVDGREGGAPHRHRQQPPAVRQQRVAGVLERVDGVHFLL